MPTLSPGDSLATNVLSRSSAQLPYVEPSVVIEDDLSVNGVDIKDKLESSHDWLELKVVGTGRVRR